MGGVQDLLDPIRRLHARIRDAVVSACERLGTEALSRIEREEKGDTIFAVDRISEDLVVEFFERELSPHSPMVLVAEGIHSGQMVLPGGKRESDAVWRIVVDPIDGTREIMYQKRSAWILTAVAPNRGPVTTLQDVELAVQTEIPLIKQHLTDEIWAFRGRGTQGERLNRLSGERIPLLLEPSRSTTIAHGFAMISRFFPGARDVLAAIDEDIVRGALGPARAGKTHCFEDQYSSSGGQLYELMAGHDRFVADLRPLLKPVLESRGQELGICCHPYDVCTELIAREAGVIVTDEKGEPLRAPLDIGSDVAWVGYANPQIRAQIEPLLQAALRDRGLMV